MLPSKSHFFHTIIHQLHGKSKKMYRQTTKQDYLEIVCNVTVWRCWLSSTYTRYGLPQFDFLCRGLVIVTIILITLTCCLPPLCLVILCCRESEKYQHLATRCRPMWPQLPCNSNAAACQCSILIIVLLSQKTFSILIYETQL